MANKEGKGVPPTGHLLGDRYLVGDLVGRGGMASVYRAEDKQLGRTVAIKIFADESDPNTHGDRKSSEVRVLASLNHPALVTVFDADLDGQPSPYLVMELVDGPPLDRRLESGPIAPAEVAAMAKDLAEALAVVHAAGIVHRDIKPSNVLLTGPRGGREFRAKLADFGIAQLVDGTRLTVTGTFMGTVGYLPPEQLGDAPPAPSADIYSLGLVLLECLTGERAFPGTPAESMSARLASDPTVPESVPGSLRDLLLAMTARNPVERPTASQVFTRAARAKRQLHEDTTTGQFATVPLPNTPVSPDDLATVPLSDSDSSNAPTVAFATSEPAPAAPRAVREPRAPREKRAPRERPVRERRSRGPLVGVIIAAALGAIVAAAVLGFWGASQLREVSAEPSHLPAAPSQLPALDEPLGSHFEQLLESVSP
ncbi:MAG: serine/threonine-protein kinase [Rhodoglobus sp.]